MITALLFTLGVGAFLLALLAAADDLEDSEYWEDDGR